MGRRCVTCSRGDLEAVNAALLGGGSRRAISAQFGIAHSSLDRHWVNCIPARIRAAAAAGDERTAAVLDGEFLLRAVSELLTQAQAVYDDLSTRWQEGDRSVRPADLVRALGHQQRVLESAFKLSQAVTSRPDRPDDALPVERPDIDAAIIAALASRGHWPAATGT